MPLKKSFRALGALSLLFAVAGAHAQVGSGAVTFNGGATQDFDTLASTGTSDVLPAGWYFREAGGSTQTTYQADDGSLNQGNVMSYGTVGSTDRAFGVLPGNTLGSNGTIVADIGARITNVSGASLASLQVAFVTELWLYQGAVGERFAFEYSTDATSLTSGTWTALTALDAVTPAASGNGKKDGNLAANRLAVSGTITGLSVANGSDLWVRWRATNQSGNDNGIAIDDVVFGTPVDNPPFVASTQPEEDAVDVPVTAEITLTFSEVVTVDDAGVALLCGGSNQPVLVDGSSNEFSVVPASNLPYGSACELTIDADAVTDVDGTLQDMAADFVLQFTTVVDSAPFLASSTPANGSSTFPANASLQLGFSEPVTVGAAWFEIACDVSGLRNPGNTVVSGGPVNFTLNPNTDFTQGETCTLQLDPSQISDQDGNADTLAGNTPITFTPAAAVVNQPPVVLSTTPMQGADDFPPFGDIVVLFSEPVTLQPGAFALTCTASTGIALSYPNSGTSFTVDTGTALAASDSCTFSIDRTKVQDSEGANPSANTVVNFSVAASSAGGYYSQVNTSSPSQLRCSLHETIKGHTLFGYGWDQLEVADEDPNDSGKILDIYRNCSFTKVSSRVGNGGAATTCGGTSGLRYNREHVWPRSLGFNNGNNNLAAHNDLHMLHLSDETFNGHRGNKPFAYCTQASGCIEDRPITNNGDAGGNGTYPGNSNWYTSTDGSTGSYEVWHRWRGNMARAIFYMAIRYEGLAAETAHDGDIPDLELTDNRSLIVQTSNTAAKAYMGLLTVLLEWHLQDPVDARELERNEVVFGFQGNRNPFVDHPEWATRELFESTPPATCVLGGGSNTAPVAVDDLYAATEDALLTVAALDGVLDNDTDADNDALTALLVAQAANGTVALATNGSFTYQPAANFCGADQFTYRASDGQAQSAVAIARINVACVNDPPQANDDTLTIDEDAAATVVNVLANDSIAPDTGETLGVTAVTQGSIGSVTLSGGVVRYTPDANANGSDSFTYTISDGNGGTDTATVTVTINPINDVPTAIGTLADRSGEEGVSIAPFSVAGGFADIDAGDTLEYTQSGLPAGLTLDAQTGEISGTPDAGSSSGSPYTVTITATDGGGETAQQSFQYTIDPAAPVEDAIFGDGFED